MDTVLDSLRRVLNGLWEMPFQPWERLYWVYLVTAVLAAYAVFRRRRREESFLRYLFPKKLYATRDAGVDLAYMLVNKAFLVFVLTPLVLTEPRIRHAVGAFFANLATWVGSSQAGTSGWGLLVFYTLVMALVIDLSQYLAHWLLHKVSWLWEFHKVHHSAQVLTPLVTFRVHPVDFLLHGSLGVLAGGLVGGCFHLLSPGGLSQVSLYGVPLVTLFFNILANLRHSHVWLTYPRFLSHVFVSPAQHQVHHSSDRKHFDKNLGVQFSLWDWAFGTLYIPTAEDEESLEFGLGTHEDGEYSSVLRLYLRPFQQLGLRLTRWVFRRGSAGL